MNVTPPPSLGLIAGKGAYPGLLAGSAHEQGVSRVVAVAFKGETHPSIRDAADEVHWVHLGQLDAMLKALADSGVKQAVMAGQITPTHLFRIRMDRRMLGLLARLHARNAETIFGAVAEELESIGIELMPASSFMEAHMPEAGQLAARAPTKAEAMDIQLGLRIARVSSGLDVGQTVVVKDGTVLAVEAFEGTDEAIRRAARLGGQGVVVAKAAKPTHDMRFDIPVIGLHTLRLLKKVRAAVLAVEADRCIFLEREAIIQQADRMGLCILSVDGEPASAETLKTD